MKINTKFLVALIVLVLCVSFFNATKTMTQASLESTNERKHHSKSALENISHHKLREYENDEEDEMEAPVEQLKDDDEDEEDEDSKENNEDSEEDNEDSEEDNEDDESDNEDDSESDNEDEENGSEDSDKEDSEDSK